jgi:hypothetical protein
MDPHHKFDADRFLEAEVRRLIEAYEIKTVIETGTYKGETTLAFTGMVPDVHSIEISPERFAEVPQWANGLGVKVYHGDSAQVLPHLLKNKFEDRVLFYLDAHWGAHSPLLDELEAIAEAKLPQAPIIVIHDFFNPNRPEFGWDKNYDIGPYKLELIAPVIEKIYAADPCYYYNSEAEGQKRGVIFIGPGPFKPLAERKPTLAVVYVTYRQDLCWIVYSLQLLAKHLKGNYRIVVRAEPDCEEIITQWGIPATYHYVKPWPDGYAFKMYQCLIADQFTEADLIMLVDSDHMLLEPTHLGRFFEEGKPIVRYRPWNDEPNDPGLVEGWRQWAPPVQRTLGIPLDMDYMLGPPFIFHRETFPALRNRVEEVTGLPFHDAVYSDKPYHYQNFLTHPKVFCDYEALGLYAAKFESQRYALVRHVKGGHWPFRVYWSHGDWNAGLATHFQAIVDAP